MVERHVDAVLDQASSDELTERQVEVLLRSVWAAARRDGPARAVAGIEEHGGCARSRAELLENDETRDPGVPTGKWVAEVRVHVLDSGPRIRAGPFVGTVGAGGREGRIAGGVLDGLGGGAAGILDRQRAADPS